MLFQALLTVLSMNAMAIEPSLDVLLGNATKATGMSIQVSEYVGRDDRYKQPLTSTLTTISNKSFQDAFANFKTNCGFAKVSKIKLETWNNIGSDTLSINVKDPSWIRNFNDLSERCEKLKSKIENFNQNQSQNQNGFELSADFTSTLYQGKKIVIDQLSEWVDFFQSRSFISVIGEFQEACLKSSSISKIEIGKYDHFDEKDEKFHVRVDYLKKPEAFLEKIEVFTESCKSIYPKYAALAKSGVENGVLFSFRLSNTLNGIYSFEQMDKWIDFLTPENILTLRSQIIARSEAHDYSEIKSCAARIEKLKKKRVRKLPKCDYLIPVEFSNSEGPNKSLLRTFFGIMTMKDIVLLPMMPLVLPFEPKFATLLSKSYLGVDELEFELDLTTEPHLP